MDAAGGSSSLNLQSTPQEINTVLQCSKEDFVKAVEFMVSKGIIRVDNNGIFIISPWDSKLETNK